MTDQLRQALRAAADEAPPYPVLDRARRTARRRTRGRIAVTLVGAAALVVLLASGLPGMLTRATSQPASPAPGVPSLPDRVVVPPAWGERLTDSPPGPASVIFGGQGFVPGSLSQVVDAEGDLAVVGADRDVYREWPVGGWEARAGEHVTLSPDGGRIAVGSGFGADPFRVFDLRTGRQRRYADLGGDQSAKPLAWSPDGRIVAVASSTGTVVHLGLIDVDSGGFRQVGKLAGYPVGFGFAFGANGRFAYADGTEIVVVGRDLRELSRFESGASWLAGKGAWRPDGTLVMVERDQSGCGSWSVATRAPANGSRVRSGLPGRGCRR